MSEQTNYDKVLIALLEAGADVNARDNNGYTALDYALISYNDSGAKILRDADGLTGQEIDMMSTTSYH